MRRLVGPILIGAGAFLFVTGLLLRFYAYPALAVAPPDQNTLTTLEATGATILDTSTLSDITTDLTVRNRTVGDVKGSDAAPDGVVVWVDTTSYRDSDGNVRSRSTEREAFDDHDGLAVNCCGEFLEETDGERKPVKHVGLIDKFPFGTEKKTYPVWDPNLEDAVQAKYVKSSKINGLPVYQFEASVPKTTVGALDVPPSVLGESGTFPLTAQETYTNHTTWWVEPTTGVIIDRKSEAHKGLDYQGEERAITTAGTFEYTDATIKQNISDYKGKATSLKLVHTAMPLIGVIGGLLLIALGIVLARRRSPARTAADADEDFDV